jgi:hypothetical protein
MKQTPVNSTNAQTLRETLKSGQYIRNGGLQLFRILAISDNQILIQNQDQTKQRLQMSTTTFIQLWLRKNYQQVLQPENYLREWVESKGVGAQRLMIK